MKFKKVHVILLSLVVVLIAARLALPYWLKSEINKQLDTIESYRGHVDDVGLALWRGSYQIYGIDIVKRNGVKEIPFFKMKEIDASIFWPMVWKGALVLRMRFDSPELHFIDSSNEAKQQTGAEQSWDQLIVDTLPIRIDRLVVHNGRVHFHNTDHKPEVNIFLSDIEIEAENLTNSLKVSDSLMASATFSAKAMDQGKLDGSLKFNPLAKSPHFQLNFRMLGLKLTTLNNFTVHYAGVDFEKGVLDVVSEVGVKDRQLNGYIKPLFRDFAVLKWPEDFKEKNFFQVAKEAVIAGLMEIFENQPKDQFATRIPLQGTIDKKDTRVWPIVVNVLKNAFVRAFLPRYDKSEKSEAVKKKEKSKPLKKTTNFPASKF